MKNAIIASVFVMGVAACGGDARTTLVDACIADDLADKATCACITDRTMEDLDPKVVDAWVKATKQDNVEAYIISELSAEEVSSFSTAMMTSLFECGVEALDE